MLQLKTLNNPGLLETLVKMLEFQATQCSLYVEMLHNQNNVIYIWRNKHRVILTVVDDELLLYLKTRLHFSPNA